MKNNKQLIFTSMKNTNKQANNQQFKQYSPNAPLFDYDLSFINDNRQDDTQLYSREYNSLRNDANFN